MDNPLTAGFDTGVDTRTGAGLINAQLAVGFASSGVISNDGQIALNGTHLNDSIVGGALDNAIAGGDGADFLRGNDGNDSLLGGAGKDSLYGGEGDDQLATSGDGDFLYGAAGADTYIFTGIDSSRAAVIFNLATAETIDFSLVDVDSVAVGRQAMTFSTTGFHGVAGEFILKYHASNDRTQIKIDMDGDGKTDHQVVLNGGDHTDFVNFAV